MRRSNSADTTDDDALGLEISSEGESVWSDEEIYYPSASQMQDLNNPPRNFERRRRRSKTAFVDIDINAPEIYGRRARRSHSCHVPKVTWSDVDSDMDDDPADFEAQTADLKMKPGHLQRSRSLQRLLRAWNKDHKNPQQRNSRPAGKQVTFEIGSDDDDTLPVVECRVHTRPLSRSSLSKQAA